jgi:hypothetical protein
MLGIFTPMGNHNMGNPSKSGCLLAFVPVESVLSPEARLLGEHHAILAIPHAGTPAALPAAPSRHSSY